MATDAALGGVFGGVAYGIGKGVSALRGGAKTAAAEGVPGGFCFTAGTLVQTENGLVPIETIEVGHRVETLGDPEESKTEVDPSTWRLLRIRMPNPDGSNDTLELKILRGASWIAETGAAEGRWISFGLPEMGIYGPAHVETVGAVPPIQPGHGRVVLSTVTHLNGEVMVVQFQGTSETLEPTATHRLYSTTRDAWVRTGELREGEWLLGRNGPVQIAAVTPKPGVHRVFNIEVETKHTYAVSALGILSHNQNPCAAGGGRTVFRQLSAEDAANLEAGRSLVPKGTSNDIAGHVQGRPTGHISASKTTGATKRFDSGNGLAEIDVDLAQAGGAKFIDHNNVMQAVRRGGNSRAVRDASRAEEVLFRGPIPANAVKVR